MNVAVLGRTLSKLEEVRDKINELGGNGLAVVCDVVDKDSVINAKKIVNDTFGKVDILVNGAGGNHPKGTTTKEYFEKGDIENPNVVSFFDLSKENFNYVFDLNIVGTLIPTQVFIVDMLDNPGANVLNIASMSSYHAITKVAHIVPQKPLFPTLPNGLPYILQKAVSESTLLHRAGLKQYRIKHF